MGTAAGKKRRSAACSRPDGARLLLADALDGGNDCWLSLLPPEILGLVLRHLDVIDYINLRECSRGLYRTFRRVDWVTRRGSNFYADVADRRMALRHARGYQFPPYFYDYVTGGALKYGEASHPHDRVDIDEFWARTWDRYRPPPDGASALEVSGCVLQLAKLRGSSVPGDTGGGWRAWQHRHQVEGRWLFGLTDERVWRMLQLAEWIELNAGAVRRLTFNFIEAVNSCCGCVQYAIGLGLATDFLFLRNAEFKYVLGEHEFLGPDTGMPGRKKFPLPHRIIIHMPPVETIRYYQLVLPTEETCIDVELICGDGVRAIYVDQAGADRGTVCVYHSNSKLRVVSYRWRAARTGGQVFPIPRGVQHYAADTLVTSVPSSVRTLGLAQHPELCFATLLAARLRGGQRLPWQRSPGEIDPHAPRVRRAEYCNFSPSTHWVPSAWGGQVGRFGDRQRYHRASIAIAALPVLPENVAVVYTPLDESAVAEALRPWSRFRKFAALGAAGAKLAGRGEPPRRRVVRASGASAARDGGFDPDAPVLFAWY